MAPSSSSTRKAARLAQKGKGKRVRFQGGTLFPMVVSVVLVLGLALIVYARASRPAADASAPQPGEDHWHAAYGFQICSDDPTITLNGDLEVRDDQGNIIGNQDFVTTGVHSHDDGVIHWHPYASKASGRRAQLGIFFDNYGVDLSNDTLEFPDFEALNFRAGAPDNPDDFPLTYEEGETQCAGEDATLKVVVWDDYTDPTSDHQYVSDFDEIPFNADGLVVVVAFVPDDVDVEMPSWAANLPELGAADSGVIPTTVAPGDTASDGTGAETTVTDGTVTETTATGATDSTEPTETTEPADTTEPASDTTEGSPDTTEE